MAVGYRGDQYAFSKSMGQMVLDEKSRRKEEEKKEKVESNEGFDINFSDAVMRQLMGDKHKK